jgi:hypothetical protein
MFSDLFLIDKLWVVRRKYFGVFTREHADLCRICSKSVYHHRHVLTLRSHLLILEGNYLWCVSCYKKPVRETGRSEIQTSGPVCVACLSLGGAVYSATRIHSVCWPESVHRPGVLRYSEIPWNFWDDMNCEFWYNHLDWFLSHKYGLQTLRNRWRMITKPIFQKRDLSPVMFVLW